MSDFSRFNKIPGIYKIINPKHLKIKIILVPKEGINTLPTYDNFTSDTSVAVEQTLTEPDHKINEEFTLSWQEKLFSTEEYKYYSDIHNCHSETELKYHNIVKNREKICKIFTYIDGEYGNNKPFDDGVEKISSFFQKITLNKSLKPLIKPSLSTRQLFPNKESLAEEHWISMHVMMDQSKYDEDSNMVFKDEAILLSLYWNRDTQILVSTPNANNVEWEPYLVENSNGIPWNYLYGVDLVFSDDNDLEDKTELQNMLIKLLNKWDRKHKYLINFELPPVGMKHYFVILEILTATNFDVDDYMYIEFTIKLPHGTICKDSLTGRTHTVTRQVIDKEAVFNYGHIIELKIECNSITEMPSIRVYLEAISQDWWNRHRTEGYSALSLALRPGDDRRSLPSVRPEEKNQVHAENRRFFLGGCNLLKDLDVLLDPDAKDDFRLVGTGAINIRWHVISQCQSGIKERPSASALMLGADDVLRQYQEARARLAAATGDFIIDSESN